jgi:hypothetical protein
MSEASTDFWLTLSGKARDCRFDVFDRLFCERPIDEIISDSVLTDLEIAETKRRLGL